MSVGNVYVERLDWLSSKVDSLKTKCWAARFESEESWASAEGFIGTEFVFSMQSHLYLVAATLSWLLTVLLYLLRLPFGIGTDTGTGTCRHTYTHTSPFFFFPSPVSVWALLCFMHMLIPSESERIGSCVLVAQLHGLAKYSLLVATGEMRRRVISSLRGLGEISPRSDMSVCPAFGWVYRQRFKSSGSLNDWSLFCKPGGQADKQKLKDIKWIKCGLDSDEEGPSNIYMALF